MFLDELEDKVYELCNENDMLRQEKEQLRRERDNLEMVVVEQRRQVEHMQSIFRRMRSSIHEFMIQK
jgi:FtsZ-binding cell division protein ZapB